MEFKPKSKEEDYNENISTVERIRYPQYWKENENHENIKKNVSKEK